MRFVVIPIVIGFLFALLLLCEEEKTEVDAYQEALIREVVLGRYGEARRIYLVTASTSRDERIKWLCLLRAALCAEKLGDLDTAKQEYSRIAEDTSCNEVADSAKIALLRVDTRLKRRLRIIEILQGYITAYRSLEAEFNSVNVEEMPRVVRKSGVSDLAAYYFGIQSFYDGVDAYRRRDYRDAKKRFEEALNWLPDFNGAAEYLSRCRFILDEGGTVTGEPPKPDKTVISYLSESLPKEAPDEEMLILLLKKHEALRWLPDGVLRRIEDFCESYNKKFSELAARISGTRMADVERLDGELTAMVKRLKKALSNATKERETIGVADATPSLWLRVLLIERSLKEIGVIDVERMRATPGRSEFIYGTVDLSVLRKTNPKVLAAVEWRLDKESVEAKAVVKRLTQAEGFRLSALSLRGERLRNRRIRVTLKLFWKKEGRVFTETVEHTVMPIFGFAEIFGGWRLGRGLLFGTVEWGEK